MTDRRQMAVMLDVLAGVLTGREGGDDDVQPCLRGLVREVRQHLDHAKPVFRTKPEVLPEEAADLVTIEEHGGDAALPQFGNDARSESRLAGRGGPQEPEHRSRSGTACPVTVVRTPVLGHVFAHIVDRSHSECGRSAGVLRTSPEAPP
jgi:hypothetical protein